MDLLASRPCTLRTLLRALMIGVVLAAMTPLLVTPASAGPVRQDSAGSSAAVSVADFSFTPAHVSVRQGGTVTWTFKAMHTTTSDQSFWNSGRRSSGTFSTTLPDAGTYGYHCTMHRSMTGTVKVPMTSARPAAHTWRIRWSTRSSVPSSRRYDVQVRRPGSSTWSSWMSRVSSTHASYRPARSGTFAFRARTHNGGTGAMGWSPVLSVPMS